MPADAASLVGRTAELGRLVGHVERPDAALMVVLGEGGIGKTRLVDELVARAAPTHLVVRGRADEHETTPFGLWHGPSDQLGLARPRADDTTPIAELRWDVVDGLTSGLSAAGSTLLVLEDIQWADDDSLWVL